MAVPEAQSLEEYLAAVDQRLTEQAIKARVPEHNMVSALCNPSTSNTCTYTAQDVHQDTSAACDAFMLDCLSREWDAEKVALATGLGRPLGAFTTPSPMMGAHTPSFSSTGALQQQQQQQGATTPAGRTAPVTGPAAMPALSPLPGGVTTMSVSGASGRLEAYAAAMPRLVDAHLKGTSTADAADAFRAALTQAPGAADGTVPGGGATLTELWRAVSCVLRGAAGHGGGAPGMLLGARHYLETGHVAFMRTVVDCDPVRAALGGAASNIALLHAFLRVKLRDVGPLDFDVVSATGAGVGAGGMPASPTPQSTGGAVVDTAWQGAFYAARSGMHSEAVSSAARGRSGGDLATLLATWAGAAASGGAAAMSPLTPAAAAAAAEEADRCLREPPGRPGRAHRAALAAMLAGDGVLADAVQSTFPELFPTIEDFLWFKLATVRSAESTSNVSLGGGMASPDGGSPFLSTPGGAGASTNGGAAASGPGSYTLADLQNYLARFPASHYAKNGKEPLLGAAVLVLSLRLAGAVTFLTSDPLAEGYAVDGAHLAACLALAGQAALSGAGVETRGDVASAVGGVLLALGRQLCGPAPGRAADYLALAAAPLATGARASGVRGARAEEDAVLAALMREVLRHKGAPAALLDVVPQPAGTARSAAANAFVLARLVPDEAARARLVATAAGECEAAGLLDQALDLHLRCGAYDAALGLVNRQLGDALAALDGDAAPRVAALRAKGAPFAQQAVQQRGDTSQVTAFNQLCAVDDVMQLVRANRQGDIVAAVRNRPELSFIPLEPARADRCAAQLEALHPAVLARLPDVLLAVARAVAAPGGAASAALAPGAPPANAERARRDAQAALAAFTVSSRFRIPPYVYAELARLAPVA